MGRLTHGVVRPLRCGYAASHEHHQIEAAIERLPATDVEELAAWLETLRTRRATTPAAEAWLSRTRGAARPGVKTTDVMALTRGDE